MMIDFTKCVEKFNSYKGSEVKKKLIYNNREYLVKFPDPVREKNKKISYINNAYSEYVGSNVFKLIGFDTQNTILGKYNYNDKVKIVCACEDFTSDNVVLYEFENLVLSINPEEKIGTDINGIMDIIDGSSGLIDVEDTRTSFWDMFIVDAIIGNTDRHNGNWGFLVDKADNKTRFAPIYDCGSCLNPMYDDEEICLFSDSDIKNMVINCYACFKEDGKRISYISYISSMKNEECNLALKRVVPKIDIDIICVFIDNIEGMSDVRKTFYKKLICDRYCILKGIYDKLLL